MAIEEITNITDNIIIYYCYYDKKYCFVLFSPATVLVPSMFGFGFIYLATTAGSIRSGSVNNTIISLM